MFQNVGVAGDPRFTNINRNIPSTVNVATHGLDNLKEFVSFSALHDSPVQDPERYCHPSTRRNILHKTSAWMDNPNAPERILWLHGPAGAGKSAIAQTISYSYDRDKIGAPFFFFRLDPIRNEGNRLFPTLAWQLASSIPIAKDLIASSLEEDPDLPRRSIETQFEQLIARPFLTMSSGEPAAPTSTQVIIIDGLDECSDVKLQQRILKIIGNAVAEPCFPLRFIISSRTEADIQDFFSQLQYPTLQIDLANADDASRDIEVYLTSEFARIAVERDFDPSWPGQQKMQRLVSKSAGQFSYATNVVRFFGDRNSDAITQLDIILETKPQHESSPFAELDAIYTEILQRQPKQDFLKIFLHLLVAHSSILEDNLSDDDVMLMDISRVDLGRKPRRMRSTLKFEPYIDVHYPSFLEFLQDSSRSGEYHVSRSAGMRRYLELITKLLIGHAATLITQPDFHETDHFAPKFGKLINGNPQAIELNIEDWEQILRPLLDVLNKLLSPSNINSFKAGYCRQCQFLQTTFDTLTYFKSLRDREDSNIEKCLKSLEEIIGNGDPDRGQQDFDMNFGRHIFGSAAIVGTVMAILAHHR